MMRARQLIVGVLLLVAIAAIGSTHSWSQGNPDYATWLANSEALYTEGVDEMYLLNQLETDHYVKDAGRGGSAEPGMYFPNFNILDIDGKRFDLYETTKGEGQFVVLFTGSGFT